MDFHRSQSSIGHLTCLISIDMANAFNAVDWNLLKAKIFLLNIPTYLKNIIANFLDNRSVVLHNHFKHYNKGIPQGSCLGPILWNVFLNDFLQLQFGNNIKVQAFADDLLIMIKAPASYCFTNLNALHVLAGIPPLDLKLKHDLRLFQLKHCNKELCSNGMVIHPTSLSFLKPILPPWNCASFPWTPFDDNLQGVLIFTDGSKMDNKVAGAFVVYHNSIETYHSTFRLSDHATVYMAELFAIYKAVEFLSLQNFEEAHIITDSRSVLQALQNVNNIDALVSRLKNIICCLKCKLHLHWIKAHVGFAGNERADCLAKSATNYPSVDIMVDFTPSIVKRLLHRTILEDWQNRWNLSTKGRSVYELYREVKVSRIPRQLFPEPAYYWPWNYRSPPS
ncbi:uncharacterized protein CDAR_173531 [Caerostris darwini]|uniref:RNase H type-1 domain-containing protein n=1 Tax=Caerostris darwini TaxID=1538125 RepID=A0AAV4S9K1_9ARAC|nr:uncharacterized protein CDAR_173531 [Caerostris darwini]